jgi:hypothetical protein
LVSFLAVLLKWSLACDSHLLQSTLSHTQALLACSTFSTLSHFTLPLPLPLPSSALTNPIRNIYILTAITSAFFPCPLTLCEFFIAFFWTVLIIIIIIYLLWFDTHSVHLCDTQPLRPLPLAATTFAFFFYWLTVCMFFFYFFFDSFN